MGTRLTRALNVVLNQFSVSGNLLDLIRSFVNRIEEVDLLLGQLATLRWIDSAEGVWLDDVGEIVGIDRPFEEVNPDNIFTFKTVYTDPDDPNKGFGSVPPPDTGGYFQSVWGIFTSTHVDDTEYRKWIKVKIDITYQTGTIPDMYTFVKNAFDAESVISDVTDPILGLDTGLVTIELLDPLTPGQKRFLLKYVPRLAGVKVELVD